MKYTVGVAMIAKNEKDFIGRALESVKDADEIVVCDTGSTDGGATIEVAKKYTDKVFDDYKWEDSFCKARNNVKSRMTTSWILSLDCDEFIHDFSKVREAIELAEAQGAQAVNITQIAEGTGQVNIFPRLFKNSPGIEWGGNAHNHLNVSAVDLGDVKLTYGHSNAHELDKDRTLRILEKDVKSGVGGAREMYYLGREYWYRQRYQEATAILGKYVQISNFPAEKADAFLMMARCYWAQRMTNDAKDACLQAIKENPNFREALLFMSEISWPREGERWRSFAALADNNKVLFVRA